MTVNTDFAQVEEDLQQVNLTRFDVFYPEKRDFFLEGQGIFDFGGQAGFSARTATVPIMFFSRRVGLSNGQSVPVIAGGRLTGKAGKFDVGGLVITTNDKPEAGARPDDVLGDARATEHPAAQQRRVHRDEPVACGVGARSQHDGRRRRRPALLSEHPGQPLLGAHLVAGLRRATTARAIARAFSTAATATGSKSIASSSGPTSTPKWDSSAAGTWR